VISALVLAAGLARRFGAMKQLALYKGQPLVRHVVSCFQGSGVHEVVVVVSSSDAPYLAALDGIPMRVRLAVVDQPERGMSRSLQHGLSLLDSRTDAVLVALADQPTIQRSVVRALVREWHTSRSLIVAPSYKGERGHPVLFDAAVFPELYAISGDRGAREVIEYDPSRVALVPVDADPPKDVDTPDDLAAL
jgi:molybdenum cofactor cytidylyltransferase